MEIKRDTYLKKLIDRRAKIPASFPKMLIVGRNTKPWRTENGFQIISIFDFFATGIKMVENQHV